MCSISMIFQTNNDEAVLWMYAIAATDVSIPSPHCVYATATTIWGQHFYKLLIIIRCIVCRSTDLCTTGRHRAVAAYPAGPAVAGPIFRKRKWLGIELARRWKVDILKKHECLEISGFRVLCITQYFVLIRLISTWMMAAALAPA